MTFTMGLGQTEVPIQTAAPVFDENSFGDFLNSTNTETKPISGDSFGDVLNSMNVGPKNESISISKPATGDNFGDFFNMTNTKEHATPISTPQQQKTGFSLNKYYL